MTNEEKTLQIYNTTYQQCIEDGYPKKIATACAIMSKTGAEIMADWKEQQFSIERKQLIGKANQAVTQSFEDGAIFKKKEMIDKACDWLGMLRDGFVMRDFLTGSSYPKDDLLNDFRKAMEK